MMLAGLAEGVDAPRRRLVARAELRITENLDPLGPTDEGEDDAHNDDGRRPPK